MIYGNIVDFNKKYSTKNTLMTIILQPYAYYEDNINRIIPPYMNFIIQIKFKTNMSNEINTCILNVSTFDINMIYSSLYKLFNMYGMYIESISKREFDTENINDKLLSPYLLTDDDIIKNVQRFMSLDISRYNFMYSASDFTPDKLIKYTVEVLFTSRYNVKKLTTVFDIYLFSECELDTIIKYRFCHSYGVDLIDYQIISETYGLMNNRKGV